MGELNLDDIRKNAELVSATRHRWANEVGVRDPDVLDGLRRAKQLAVDDVLALLAEVERLRRERKRPAEMIDRIAQAIGDPGSIVGRKLGPSWGEGNAGYSPHNESVTRWSTRAVLAVLRGESRG